MPKSNYSKLLANPRWQKKRLEILQRDDFQCRGCSKPEPKSLHVHHLYYCPDRFPWQYPDWALVTLCSDCHSDLRGELEMDEPYLKSDVFGNWEKIIGVLSDNGRAGHTGMWRLMDAIVIAKSAGHDDWACIVTAIDAITALSCIAPNEACEVLE